MFLFLLNDTLVLVKGWDYNSPTALTSPLQMKVFTRSLPTSAGGGQVGLIIGFSAQSLLTGRALAPGQAADGAAESLLIILNLLAGPEQSIRPHPASRRSALTASKPRTPSTSQAAFRQTPAQSPPRTHTHTYTHTWAHTHSSFTYMWSKSRDLTNKQFSS